MMAHPISSKEFKRLLEQSYAGKKKKPLIALEVNDLDTPFFWFRNKVVKQTINRIEEMRPKVKYTKLKSHD